MDEGVAVLNLADISSLGGVPRRTKTIGYVSSGASVLSWTADQDYDIIAAYGGNGTLIVNFSGNSYASMATAGVHTEWIALTSTGQNVPTLNQRLHMGQVLFFSFSGIGSGMVILAYLT